MKNFIKIFSHILIWTIILVVPMFLMLKDGSFESKPYINYVARIVFYAILFYINYIYLIDRFLFKKKFILYLVINIALIIVFALLQSGIAEALRPSPEELFEKYPRLGEKGPHPGPPFAMRMVVEYLSILFVIGLSVAIKATSRWHRDSIHLEQAKNMQLEADLRNLRTQLNPHFLFNTLNNIYSLIAVDQSRAQDAVYRLSNLLRYVMYDNNEKFVPIDKELEFTKNYIDLMKLRLSSDVKLNVLIDNKGSTDMIASLMFITLIENAFKHGINSGKDSFIDISILVDPGIGVLCTIENSFVEKEDNLESRTGIGLANLSRRLELLYPNRYEFTVEKRTNSFFTLLRINFNNKSI